MRFDTRNKTNKVCGNNTAQTPSSHLEYFAYFMLVQPFIHKKCQISEKYCRR